MKPLKPSRKKREVANIDPVSIQPVQPVQPVVNDTEPIIVAQSVDEDASSTSPNIVLADIVKQQQPITLQQYLECYTEVIRLKEENLKLRSKLITVQEDLKQWKEKKASKRSKLQGEDLKNAFIDLLLNSDLNIESIPDEVEREIYSFILNQVSASTSIIRKLFFCG